MGPEPQLFPIYKTKRLTVLGVVLQRGAPDIWHARGWSFQRAEGAYPGWGPMEWRAYSPDGVMSIHGTLRSAVSFMLRGGQ